MRMKQYEYQQEPIEKKKVEFDEETPKIFYKWKWFSVITMNIFIKIGKRIFIETYKK